MKKLIVLLSAVIAVVQIGRSATFDVKVPEGTKKCYVCGKFNGWSAVDAVEMTMVDIDRFKLELPDVSESDVANGFKYLCGRDWAYVEKSASGGEIDNRTVTGSPDVVESWASVPQWEVETLEMVLNGISRQVRVYLPEGYEESSDESYPVMYYNTVQQRYNNAGADDDRGDDFFGAVSWNAHETMEALRPEGVSPYIMVEVSSFLSENTVDYNEDFEGTGCADEWLKAFVDELMPAINSRYRVADGAATIVGADYGALFGLYAALSRPDLFGCCVAMSPMLWINPGTFDALAASASERTAAQYFYLSSGSLEPGWMTEGVSSLATALGGISGAVVRDVVFEGAAHDDEDWGASFGNILRAMADGSTPSSKVNAMRSKAVARAAADFASSVYTLYAGEDADNMQRIGTLAYTEDFRKQGGSTAVKAYVITNDVAASVKSKYYWNVACGEDASAGWLLADNKSIGFSSKKDEISWHNVAVLEDGTTANVAAHSKGFKVVTATSSTAMTRGEAHLQTATVKFPGADKSFTVHYGSVNSASDMGAISAVCNVSDNCVEAVVTYDFNLNKVTVEETAFGQSLDDVVVESFTAVPAVCSVGQDVAVSLVLDGSCGVEISCQRDFAEDVPVDVRRGSDGSYEMTLSGVKEGIYTFTVDLVNGSNRLDGAAEINVRVLPSSTSSASTLLTVNPYRSVDWSSIGRYKANFHTHTSQSFDTKFTTTEVVDRYRTAGYSILSLTDHDANSYPWNMFSLYNPAAEDRDPWSMGMLAVPGVELSKDRRNSWSEKTGGEFNHHNDFFTGRKGQEFMSLRESYAYTQAIGGMQIINHPGQYWNLSTTYTPGAKNSPEWHAENFRLYDSLIGLEVYNQGNRRPNDRILWDLVLTLTMPERPVWGYSCDDTHTAEQYFRNYEFMLMPELTIDALKEAMKEGRLVMSYEYTGSGENKAPLVTSIEVDESRSLITVVSDDADMIEWISSTHQEQSGVASSRKSTVVGIGKTFDYSGFQGSYVRARLTNKYGETAIQPFGFVADGQSSVDDVRSTTPGVEFSVALAPDASTAVVTCSEPMTRISFVNAAGVVAKTVECGAEREVAVSVGNLAQGAYVIVGATERAAYTAKLMLP